MPDTAVRDWTGVPPEITRELIEVLPHHELQTATAQLWAYGWDVNGIMLSRCFARIAQYGANDPAATQCVQRTDKEREKSQSLCNAIQTIKSLDFLNYFEYILALRGWQPNDYPMQQILVQRERIAQESAT